MLAVLLMIGVAVGIAYPYVRNFIAERRTETSPVPVHADDPSFSEHLRPIAREELCPKCSRMNPPGSLRCFECGAEMAITSFSRLFGSDQADLVREGVQSGGLLLAMLLAMALANFLPMTGKVVLLILTVVALAYRVTRVIYN